MIVSSSSSGQAILNGTVINHGTTGVRQTVQSGSVDASGYANFISIGTGLSVNLAATMAPLNIHAAGGSIPNDRLGIIPTDTTLTLPASQTNFIMATISNLGVVTLSSVILPIVYQFGGTPSVVANQYTFNISEMKMYLGNGVSASQVWAVCIGEAVTSGVGVTSVVTYALNGMYDSDYTNTYPSALTATSKNHNIGVIPTYKKIIIKNLNGTLGFSIGEEVQDLTAGSTYWMAQPVYATTKTIGFTTTSTSAILLNKTTGVSSSIVHVDWAYKLIAHRGW